MIPTNFQGNNEFVSSIEEINFLLTTLPNTQATSTKYTSYKTYRTGSWPFIYKLGELSNFQGTNEQPNKAMGLVWGNLSYH